MVSKKRKGRPPKYAENRVEEEESENEVKDNVTSEYEQLRKQRIKANLDRMEKMGILDLSRKLRPPPKQRKTAPKNPDLPPPGLERRSSRLTAMTPVNYAEKGCTPKKEKKPVRNTKIHIEEGSKPEIYTEEHEKLLGDCKTTWTLYVDGYNVDGERIYDQYDGKSCHQCRQKTLGRHTDCSNCKGVQGQFCGDCLFMRYGENVIEANENPSWTCPVCRGICNCSRCRRVNGWAPTGNIYRKVIDKGFKSVAHYLIQSRRSQGIQEDPSGENKLSAKGSLGLEDGKSEPTDGIAKPQSDYNGGEEIKAETDHGGSIAKKNKVAYHEDSDADYDVAADDDESNEEEDNGENI